MSKQEKFDPEGGSFNLVNAIVGSQAHGTAGPNSDVDIRGIYVVPSLALLDIRNGTKSMRNTKWIEGQGTDDTAHEVGKFLHLAMTSNMHALELLNSPLIASVGFGTEIIGLFDKLWTVEGAYRSHANYASNQWGKFHKPDGAMGARAGKFLQAAIRVLYQAIILLEEDYYPVDLRATEIYPALMELRQPPTKSVGSVFNYTRDLEQRLDNAYRKRGGLPGEGGRKSTEHPNDPDTVQDVLNQIRYEYFRSIPDPKFGAKVPSAQLPDS